METHKAGFSKFGRQKKQKYFCLTCRRLFRENPEYIEGMGEKNNFWVRKNLPSAGHLILELRAFAQRLGRTPQAFDIIERSKEGLGSSANTFRAVFGTFTEALRRARLTRDYPRIYLPEQMLVELRTLRKKLRRPLLGRDIKAASKNGKGPSFYFLRRAFGSIGKAKDAAGVGKTRYDRREMIAILQKLDAKLGHRVRKSDISALYHEGKGPAPTAVLKMFGGIEKALKAAGVGKSPVRLPAPRSSKVRRAGKRTAPVKFTDDELIEQLQKLAKGLGRAPIRADIDRASKDGLSASSRTFFVRFEGLLEAYRRAGLKETRERRWFTNEEIIASVKKLQKELGRFPGDADLRKASKAGKCPTANTVTKYLGKLSEIRSRFLSGEL